MVERTLEERLKEKREWALLTRLKPLAPQPRIDFLLEVVQTACDNFTPVKRPSDPANQDFHEDRRRAEAAIEPYVDFLFTAVEDIYRAPPASTGSAAVVKVATDIIREEKAKLAVKVYRLLPREAGDDEVQTQGATRTLLIEAVVDQWRHTGNEDLFRFLVEAADTAIEDEQLKIVVNAVRKRESECQRQQIERALFIISEMHQGLMMKSHGVHRLFEMLSLGWIKRVSAKPEDMIILLATHVALESSPFSQAAIVGWARAAAEVEAEARRFMSWSKMESWRIGRVDPMTRSATIYRVVPDVKTIRNLDRQAKTDLERFELGRPANLPRMALTVEVIDTGTRDLRYPKKS